jgi:hypothetical protein
MWMKVPLGWYEHLKTKCKVIVGGNAWNGLKDGSLAWNSNNPLSYANANYGLVAESTKKGTMQVSGIERCTSSITFHAVCENHARQVS